MVEGSSCPVEALSGPWGIRIRAKPSLSLGFFSGHLFPEYSLHHKPTSPQAHKPDSKSVSTVPKGTTPELTHHPIATKGCVGDLPGPHQHCKTALHLLLRASKGYYVLMSCCIINQPLPRPAEISNRNKQTPRICYFPFPVPAVRKCSHVNQGWVWMGSGLRQVCTPTS